MARVSLSTSHLDICSLVLLICLIFLRLFMENIFSLGASEILVFFYNMQKVINRIIFKIKILESQRRRDIHTIFLESLTYTWVQIKGVKGSGGRGVNQANWIEFRPVKINWISKWIELKLLGLNGDELANELGHNPSNLIQFLLKVFEC